MAHLQEACRAHGKARSVLMMLDSEGECGVVCRVLLFPLEAWFASS